MLAKPTSKDMTNWRPEPRIELISFAGGVAIVLGAGILVAWLLRIGGVM